MHLLIGSVVVLVGFVWALVAFPSFRATVAILVALGAIGYFVLSNNAQQENKQQGAARVQGAQQESKQQGAARVQGEEQERAKFEADRRAYCQAEQKRWAVVSPAQIEIRDPSLTQGLSYSVVNDEYNFSASAKNKSKSRVTTLRISVTALDCPVQNSRAADCDIIGHGDEKFDTEIPAGEVRRLTGKVTFRDLPKMRGVFSPRFAVDAVRAPLDQSDEADHLLAEWVYKCEVAPAARFTDEETKAQSPSPTDSNQPPRQLSPGPPLQLLPR